MAQKKQESKHKVPMQKHMAPMDMRLSRSRINMGADTHQLLATQQIAQNPSLAPKCMKLPELPSVPPPPPRVPVVVAKAQQPKVVVQPLVLPPPPPAAMSKPITPPPPPPSPPPLAVVASFTLPPLPHVTSEDRDLQRPIFKDPVPEFDDLPPRPSFK